MSASSTPTTVGQNPRRFRLRFGDRVLVDRRAPGPGFRLVVLVLAVDQVADGQLQQVDAAEDLELPVIEDLRRQQDGDEPEDEGPDDPVPEGPLLLLLRQVADHHGQHQGVVGAEQPLEDDEEEDRPADHQPFRGGEFEHRRRRVSGPSEKVQPIDRGGRADRTIMQIRCRSGQCDRARWPIAGTPVTLIR